MDNVHLVGEYVSVGGVHARMRQPLSNHVLTYDEAPFKDNAIHLSQDS
jgi:hypothetical protein